MKAVKALLVVVLLGMVASFSVVATGQSEGSGAQKKQLVFGNIAFSMKDVWNNYSTEAFNFAAKQKGVQTVVLDAQGDSGKALAAMEDLINRHVDGISVFTVTPELDVRVAKMANAAGIPVTFENSKPAEGDYTYLSVVAAQYSDIGYAAGKFISQTWPGSKLFYVMGQPGMNIVEPYMEGLQRGLKEFNTVELVGSQPTDWGAEQAMNVTQNFIQSGKKFDVIFANNEQMAQGVMNALKDAGLFGKIKIVSTGGGPPGLEMVRKGEIDATMSAPVSIQGIVTFYNLYNYVVDKKEPPKKFIPLPIIPVTKDNISAAISWEPGQNAVDYSIKYLNDLSKGM
jgi:ABC-type sugar transport system substrate-binding protein